MGTRGTHSFHFPFDKYEDEVALYANFRYLQDYLGQLSIRDKSGHEIIVAPYNSLHPERAHVQLTGDFTADSATLQALEEDYAEFLFLDGIVTGSMHSNDFANRTHAGLTIRGLSAIETTWDVQTYFPFVIPDSTDTVVHDIGFLSQGPAVIAQNEGTSVTVFNCGFSGTYSPNGPIADGNTYASFSPGFMLIANNWFSGINNEAIRSPTNSIIIGNRFEDLSTNPLAAIELAEKCVIVGNTFDGIHNSAGTAYAVSTNDTLDGSDCVIVGNRLYNMDNLGFNLSLGSGDVVMGNFPSTANTFDQAIDDLNDVTITGTPADNEVLAYDTGTSEWINQTAAEAGLSDTSHTHTQDPTDEEIQDLVGAMVTGNTETGITVTYEDADGTLDFVVDSEITTFFGATDITGAEAEELTDGSTTTLHSHAAAGGADNVPDILMLGGM